MKSFARVLAGLLISILTIAPDLGAREWTLLVYMAADNDLAFQSENDLKEMEAVGSAPGLAVVVQQDIPGAGGRRYLIQRGGRALLDSLGTVNMADPEVLKQFGIWGGSRFPAERYALILWDHGSGWSGSGDEGRQDPPKTLSFGSDWSSGDIMGIADGELRTALEGIREGLGRPLDLLAFDGCILQGAEVAFEVGGAAKIMVGSQELVPADGYPYDRFLSFLSTHSSEDEGTAAKELIHAYLSFYQGSGLEVANSALLLDNTLALAPPARALAQAFLEAPYDSGLSVARDSVLRILWGQDVDLGDFLRLAESRARGEVRTKAAKLREALGRCILVNRASGVDSSRLSGLSVWFPRTLPEFADRALEYSGLQWVPRSNWDQIVYASYGIPRGLRPTAPGPPKVFLGDNNGFAITWRPSYFPARIAAYEIRELSGRTVLWEDGAEADPAIWTLNGITSSEGDAHSGKRSYYAYRDSAWMALRGALRVDRLAWLSLWSKRMSRQRVICEIGTDSAFTTVTPLDSLTIGSKDWAPSGFALPQGSYHLRLRASQSGVYLDDLRLEAFAASQAILRPGNDTAYGVRNKPRGAYSYQIRGQDGQGVWGLWGMMADAQTNDFSPAYVFPNPFRDETRFVVDGAGSEMKVRIYTMAGDLVRTLEGFVLQSDGSFACNWDGRNERGKEAASGIYIYLITNPRRREGGTLVRIK